MSFSNYSVLMSVYAKEKPGFLRESMMGIYEQTVPTNDFVLVCDGPLNDALDEVVEDMQAKFGEVLRVVRLSKNHGLGYALNVGVTECKNELIARMDSDDVAVKDRCEKELKIFEEKDVDVVGSIVDEYNSDLKKCLSRKNVPENDAEIKKMLKKRNPMNHMTVMFKKDKVLEAGNYQEMAFFEDYYLWARMVKNGCKFYNVQESLVNVRGGAKMAERRGGIKYVKNIVRFQKILWKNRVTSAPRMFINVTERATVALMPNSMREVVYVKMLRGGSNVS